MSVSVRIYDLFSYTVPGFLYLFVFNEFFRLQGWEHFKKESIQTDSGAITVALVIVSAYVLGLLMDYFANWFFFRVLTRYKIKEASLSDLKSEFNELNIEFKADDRKPLFTALRQRNPSYSLVIDAFGANSIMLRNISFGLLLIAFLCTWRVIVEFQWQLLVATFGSLALSWIAYLRSRMFYHWFFLNIFEGALEYGATLKDVIEYNRRR